MDKQRELELVIRARGGDTGAFGELAGACQNGLYNLTLRLTGNRQDAEDAAQEALLSAWRGLPNFRMEARFSTWLYRLGVNAANDLLRRRNRRENERSLEDEEGHLQVADAASSPQEEAEKAEIRRGVRKAIGQLSPEHRQVLILREFSELSYEEIGQALELSPGTVRSRLARARLALRMILTEEGNFFPEVSSNERERG